MCNEGLPENENPLFCSFAPFGLLIWRDSSSRVGVNLQIDLDLVDRVGKLDRRERGFKNRERHCERKSEIDVENKVRR